MKQYADDIKEEKPEIEKENNNNIEETAKTGGSKGTEKNEKSNHEKDSESKSEDDSEHVSDSQSEEDDKNDSKKEKKIEKSLTAEDNLELHSLSRKERNKAKREKYRQTTADMNCKEKINYFFYYFKVPILVSLAVIVGVTFITISLYRNTRPVAISFALLNSPSIEYLTKDDFKGYMDYYDMPSSYRMIDFYSNKADIDIYEDYYSKNPDDALYAQFPSLCYNDYFDVVISDKTGIEYCGKMSLIIPPEDSLDLSMRKYINDNCPERIISVKNVNDDMTPYAIDISGTEFAESLGLDYDDVYIALPGQSARNIANSKRLLNYIFDAGLID